MGVLFGPKSVKAEPKPAEKLPAPSGKHAEHDEMLETVADELVGAFHSKDKKAVTNALRAFLAVHKASEDAGDDDDY